MKSKTEIVNSLLPPEEFKQLLLSICDRETSSDSQGWTRENPLWGHCAVVSLVAQNLFGGELARMSLEETPFARMGSHYWNILPDVTAKDFTAEQFGEHEPFIGTVSRRTRQYVLYDPKTGGPREIMNRYKLLAFRLARALNPDHKIFEDPLFKACFYHALDSPCQKLHVGCVITHKWEIVSGACNSTVEPLKDLCEPECIRFSIPSRTESMIGACEHAEESAVWKVVKSGIPLEECNLYVVAVRPDGLPLFKKEAEFTCLRCAFQIYKAKIGLVCMPFRDSWVCISSKSAVETAKLYATKERKV